MRALFANLEGQPHESPVSSESAFRKGHMRTLLKTSLRYRVHYPLRYAMDQLRIRIAGAAAGIRRVLIASDNLAFTSDEQFAPLLSNRHLLSEQMGVVFDQRLLDDVLASGRPNAQYDAVLAKLTFRTPSADALRKIARLRRQFPLPTRIIYFDGDDDACIQWSEILQHVDLYVKKQVFTNRNWYQKQFTGKNNLTDYISRLQTTSFANDAIPESGVVSEAQMDKLALGYNIALDKKITTLFQGTTPPLASEKTVDVICRAACKPDLWIYPFRGPISAALRPLSEQGYSVVTPNERVDQAQYYQEMRSSRICISPFGYGEICWRDFETVLMGALLIKPDMSHLQTEPNIFIPETTYVPVRWDFSDLSKMCAHYLANEQARADIASRAYQVLVDYYASFAFAKRFRLILEKAGVPLPLPANENALTASQAGD